MAVTSLVILAAIVAVGVALTRAEDAGALGPVLIAVAVIIPVVLMVCALFAPLGFTVDAAGVVVNRMGPKVCILHGDIAGVCCVTRQDVGFSVRLLGSGGFLGFYGRFWSGRLGKHRAYVTHARDMVLIECHSGEKFLLSPFPADIFVAAVEKARA